ncbi:methylated-DNA--[protein]-cysteine S-methyltransferase [Sinanaerobacter sp. ZZT-01]|uniref:methylated-DNA--[protein]-cysteine S-methyltransferase n=1 Tax=Sinanaerobacter sp. ZZT-01 TaxID=3111540 RepID=UPI002D7872F0|nr:methylated-DNA--[protein]-cysteine S-methyltransferase [Sinanaerobacter sp. ZZT-01]WRR94642.1 methylated-DNA--[protein]-cysteine S-methyltransferase [Sinanaerobacter sp. ZZT-01]
MKHLFFYETELGIIGFAENGRAITNVIFGKHFNNTDYEEVETPLLKEAAKQLNEYLAKERELFDLPYTAAGTPFQHSVWDALKTIPYGQTCTYLDIAKQIGKPKACRAVGMANNKNPLPILIPCHRVIGSSGKLVGYGGGMDIKKALLALEKSKGDIIEI